eukprot:CAMPEP_0185029358 /NCGR_PEP_ID=MMETSP1103-20130426/15638_1 /TAXON_ID=36769 /ORGANISM="Paraphysomonas bandaiensis, Strain Caron Lab Isolate" /LENGTH=274 /DNA_ID=CAMNT_0027564065 /DNA_START=49 /DNA_END=873 /DNA_ORIENTATION=+
MKSALVSSASSLQRSNRPKKRVSFAPGTVDNEDKGANVRIINAETVDDHVLYTVRFKHKGNVWDIRKRYSEFEENHINILNESIVAETDIPELPKKRWFELQRWLNRFDEQYTMERTKALEAYLQKLYANKHLLRRSRVYREFIQLQADPASPPKVSKRDLMEMSQMNGAQVSVSDQQELDTSEPVAAIDSTDSAPSDDCEYVSEYTEDNSGNELADNEYEFNGGYAPFRDTDTDDKRLTEPEKKMRSFRLTDLEVTPLVVLLLVVLYVYMSND